MPKYRYGDFRFPPLHYEVPHVLLLTGSMYGVVIILSLFVKVHENNVTLVLGDRE